ncbi:Crp/Fnr family transcriptional regulator [Acidocella aquatica]|uniref:Crp/Fnr family transcriptional regulator n=1 Tax=Acidocella aquatica TaxID=1922313 RepID=A0ABQ6A2T1_9PROT|nr:Crp/Fnr family transcriptional regulator [Acidocella aquatica]GLR66756.1 Crp/Fnr family transcriptional regulator [Acidocella aquatica]
MSPPLIAVPLRADKIGISKPFLSVEGRQKLALIASLSHYDAGDILFHEGDRATSILNIVSGVGKSYSFLPDGREVIQAFLFPNDLIGPLDGDYFVNTVKAITPLVAYTLPLTALVQLLQSDPNLQWQFLTKACHELRLAQQHAIALSQNSAKQRLLMLLNLLRLHNEPRGANASQIHLPMSRADIADYTGLAVETVSRGLHQLQREGIIRLINQQCIEIIDQKVFTAALVSEA